MSHCLSYGQRKRLSSRILIMVLVITGMVLIFRPPSAHATNICGLISSNTIWIPTNSPYIVTCSVVVAQGVTLTIEPGVIVKFDSNYSLQIDGELIAQGASNNLITFTSNAGMPDPSDWGYIFFTDTSVDATFDGQGNYLSGSIIRYAVIEYAGGANISNNGGLRIEAASPFIDHTTIAHSGDTGIIITNNAAPKITYNLIKKNNVLSSGNGGGIHCENGTTSIQYNTISDNSSNRLGGGTVNWGGGGIQLRNCSGIVSFNKIVNNDGGGYYGGGIYALNSNVVISDNWIEANKTSGVFGTGGGIYVYDSSAEPIAISGNVLMGNRADNGGAIYSQHGTLDIVNNIVIGNRSDGNGGGLSFETSLSKVSLSNNIISDNTSSLLGGGIYSPGYSDLEITYNTILRNTATDGSALYYFRSPSRELRYNTVIGNVSTVLTDAKTIYIDGDPLLNYNNVHDNVATYAVYNDSAQTSPNIDATSNWWGATNESSIQANIFDWFDDSSKSVIVYTPYLNTHNINAPISPPTGLSVISNGTSINLNWFSNPESDVAGYKVYYAIDSKFPYDGTGANEGNSPIDVGNVSSFTLTGLASGTQYYIVVTAYDSDADGHKDQTDGHESWFSESPTPETQNYVQVSYEQGGAVNGAKIYHNRIFVGTTDDLGRFTLTQPLQIGDTLSALQLMDETPTARDAHAGWAYRTYITNIDIDTQGNPQVFTVTQPGPQLLTVRPENTLILFNLVASVEWDATDAYIQDIAQAFDEAADFFYDATDGQMTFGQVAIYDNAEHWADADLQISAKNSVRPHAFVSGIVDNDDISHLIRVGRFWDGNTANQGDWNLPNGFKTIVHEFGHYGLGLYDEYIGYDKQGGVYAGEHTAFCTGPENYPPNTLNPDLQASIMDRHYSTSELADAGRWTSWCQQTVQHQLNNGEADWQTLNRLYGDPSGQDKWRLVTPDERAGAGQVVPGPVAIPSALPFPDTITSNLGTDPAPIAFTVCQNGNPYNQGASVALYFGGKVMEQGLTDRTGRLDILGARVGDTLRISSFDNALSGSIVVPSSGCFELSSSEVAVFDNQTGPYLRMWPTTDVGGLLDGLRLVVTRTLPTDNLNYALTGSDNIGPSNAIPFNTPTSDHRVQVNFIPTAQSGHAKVLGSHSGQFFDLNVDYRLQQADNVSDTNLFSNDGNMSMRLDKGALLSDQSYFLIASPWGLPGPLPSNLDIIGEAYEITASGSMTVLNKPAVLTLHYDGNLVNSGSALEGPGIYWWNPISEKWQEITSTLDEEQKILATSVSNLGVYALLAPPGAWNDLQQSATFLPIILKTSP